MLTLIQMLHLTGPLRIDPQLVVSKTSESKSGKAEPGFHRVLLAESKHKRQPLRRMNWHKQDDGTDERESTHARKSDPR